MLIKQITSFLYMEVCRIASAEIKISFKKKRKKPEYYDCNSFKKSIENVKNRRHAFKPPEIILLVRDGLLGAPRPDETYKSRSEDHEGKTACREVLPVQ